MAQGSQQGLWMALGLAAELGYLIAVPIVIFALAGRFLDRRIGSSPWFLLAGVILALVVSTVAIVRRYRTVVDRPTPDA